MMKNNNFFEHVILKNKILYLMIIAIVSFSILKFEVKMIKIISFLVK